MSKETFEIVVPKMDKKYNIIFSNGDDINGYGEGILNYNDKEYDLKGKRVDFFIKRRNDLDYKDYKKLIDRLKKQFIGDYEIDQENIFKLLRRLVITSEEEKITKDIKKKLLENDIIVLKSGENNTDLELNDNDFKNDIDTESLNEMFSNMFKYFLRQRFYDSKNKKTYKYAKIKEILSEILTIDEIKRILDYKNIKEFITGLKSENAYDYKKVFSKINKEYFLNKYIDSEYKNDYKEQFGGKPPTHTRNRTKRKIHRSKKSHPSNSKKSQFRQTRRHR